MRGYKTVVLAEEAWEELLDILFDASGHEHLYAAVQFQVRPSPGSIHAWEED